MPKDYKNVKKVQDNPGVIKGHALSFITGLFFGIFISFVVYIYQDGTLYKPFDSLEKKQQVSESKNRDDGDPVTTEVSTVPTPRFDFYNILPNKEINISEWVAEDQNSQNSEENFANDQSDLYILQVGSFKQFEAADQLKAQLALLGISADIQRVVINGQDTRYRVRVGPHKNTAEFDNHRKRLLENNLDFMVLKLSADDA